MATLKYVGTPAAWDSSAESSYDLVDVSYINGLLAQNMTMSAAQTQYTALLSGYATASWATSQMSGLATPAYAATQVANYQNAITIGQANGPVPLVYGTGQINPGQINIASTQTFPTPFWSPANYLSGNTSVGVGNSPVSLFTCAIPAMAYSPYVLACFGSIDTISTNTAGQPIITVVDSTNSQTIAQGYGIPTDYLGPAPGETQSQAILTTTSVQTDSYVTLTGWSANDTEGFTTTMVGNYMEIPNNGTGTVTASVTFSGASGGDFGVASVSTTIQLVNQAGTVLATGTAVSGESGTATVTYTGTFSVGQFVGVQGEQTGPGNTLFGLGAGTYGSWTGGTLSYAPPSIQNTGPATIMPIAFDNQTPLTGATTLTVYLGTVGEAGAAQATTLEPGLWVCPIPWV
jgi:hypothetical protein